MRSSRTISEFLGGRIAAGDFPAAVYAVSRGDEVLLSDALGNMSAVPPAEKASIGTVFDLASITKVLVTGMLCAQLVEERKLDLDDPVGEHIPELSGTGKEGTTLRQLLTHTSGFKAWLPLYLEAGAATPPAERPSRVLAAIAAEPLAAEPSTKVIYSDLNFILLGFVIERVTGSGIAQAGADRIFDPLGLKDTFFNPPADRVSGIAASEEGNVHERNTCAEQGYDTESVIWRSGVIRGEVHDGNCFYLGGVAGHAGLFSSVGDVTRMAKEFLPSGGSLLDVRTRKHFTENMTLGLNEARSLAFQLAATHDSTASGSLPAESFGHLGFTGTSLWIDPVHEHTFILLTNRTHGRRPPFVNINAVRRRFHELAAEEIASTT